ncbi:hypothetical protein AB0O31_34405 [Kitasatospora cineracea]|uniref:hypothetical protein n=1 Tax=Kitasatospora cineracea TaxID=88074 RepID=UPI00343AC4E1
MPRRTLFPFLTARLRRTRRPDVLTAHLDPGALVTILDSDRTAAREFLLADYGQALANLPAPLNFQPGLLGEHYGAAHLTAYLCSLAAAAETNLDLNDPGQRALYDDLTAAANTAGQLQDLIASATTRTLPPVTPSGDDPTGIHTAAPAAPLDPGPGDDPWHSLAAATGPRHAGSGSGTPEGGEHGGAEKSCVFDGAPYYGTGIRGGYCSRGCADADH